MRSKLCALTLALVACSALSACTDGGLTPDSIDDELELDDGAYDYLVQPGRAAEAAPPPATLEPYPEPDSDDDDEWGPQSYRYFVHQGPAHLSLSEERRIGDCGFGIEHTGLPAIDREAKLVVGLENENSLGPTDYDTTRVVLAWRDFDDAIVRREVLYDAEVLAEDWEQRPRVACARLRRALEAQLPELNAALDAEPLAPLEIVPVQLDHPNMGWRPPLPERGAERPVEIVYKNGALIARVQGLKVLARVPHPSWQGEPDMMDAYNPNILGVLGDPETGVTVIYRSYESASCMSDGQTYAGITRLPEAVFAEAALRRYLPRGPGRY